MRYLKLSKRIIPMVAMLLSAMLHSAMASRRAMPIGDNIRRSELIVICDTSKGDSVGEVIISVTDVIKGNKKHIGSDIKLNRRILSTADVYISNDAREIALLFSENWEKSDRWPFVEAYKKPNRIKALKDLIDIVAIDDERKRILSMQELSFKGDSDIQEQLFSELRGMKDPHNFDCTVQIFRATVS